MNTKIPFFIRTLAWLSVPALLAAKPTVDFTKDARPLLSEYCFHCHGTDKSICEANLRLDTGRSIQGSWRLPAIVPGKPGERTRLSLEQQGQGGHAPPKTGKALTPEQKKIIETWIARSQVRGALVLPTDCQPALPAKRSSDHPIDRFLEDSLSKEKLSFSPEADSVTLLRRLYFDLVGMPPTPREAERFLKNKSPKAFEQLVDRLLADERFGERMAVHWLDLVRFADTIGYHSDNFMEVSAY